MKDVIFCFGRFQLFVRERLLLRDEVHVSLGSRAFDVLVALVERSGETVNRQELFEFVWPDVVVAKVNLRVHVASLRKALDATDSLDESSRKLQGIAYGGFRDRKGAASCYAYAGAGSSPSLRGISHVRSGP
jgi:DNA-binding winged helix-turn-helix (wHTH) protein